MSLSSPVRILLAAAAFSREPIARALGPDYETSCAHTLWQGKTLLQRPVDLILCDLYFDDSRMFDLLRHARAEETTRRVPFLAIKATEGELSPAVLQGIEIACGALGAEKFIELSDWERRQGTEQAHERFRAVVRHILAAASA